MGGIEQIIGKTIAEITGGEGDVEVSFLCDDGKRFQMFHSSDCCEYVRLAEVHGDMADLIGSPILLAEESVHAGETPDGLYAVTPSDESYTWTFYKLATIKGYVTLRWLGESNGYYSESVEFVAA